MHIKRILFYIQEQSPRGVLYKKSTLAQVFSCEFCEISRNTFSYRAPPVAASVYLRKRNIVSSIYCNKLILKVTKITKIKNSRWRRSIKKVVLNNFTKFTGNTCQSILNKVARVNPATSLKKRLRHMCFPENFKNIFPAGIYLLKVNNRTLEQGGKYVESWYGQNNASIVLVSLLLTLNKFHTLL